MCDFILNIHTLLWKWMIAKRGSAPFRALAVAVVPETVGVAGEGTDARGEAGAARVLDLVIGSASREGLFPTGASRTAGLRRYS
ncbi:hypothetical protein [Streptomyces sp. NPDC093568]|uniref:hypothetical protein n=1 Tax=Streptomyces sp. NPDC093568 TaxID=3366041 RepID=UPI003813773B